MGLDLGKFKNKYFSLLFSKDGFDVDGSGNGSDRGRFLPSILST